MNRKPPYLWDYDMDEEEFKALLTGDKTIGRLNQKWAVIRVMEYAPYKEIVRLLGYKKIVEWWPKVRDRIRSPGRKRGFDFLTVWLPAEHPELL